MSNLSGPLQVLCNKSVFNNIFKIKNVSGKVIYLPLTQSYKPGGPCGPAEVHIVELFQKCAAAQIPSKKPPVVGGEMLRVEGLCELQSRDSRREEGTDHGQDGGLSSNLKPKSTQSPHPETRMISAAAVGGTLLAKHSSTDGC